eukprot:jgi/Mesen1/2224/ME000152S01317
MPAENEKSFQVLQEYLSVAQDGGAPRGPDGSGSGSGSSAPRFYHLTFFIRKTGIRHGTDETAGTSAGGLERVEVVLPPPQRPRYSGSTLLSPTRVALGRLFAACGLPAEVPALFHRAAEMQRRSESTPGSSLERQAVFVRNALRMGRGVFAKLRAPASEAPPARQVAALERLARALDRAPKLELAGVTLVLAGEYGVDPHGSVWLDHAGEAEEWAAFLRQVDVAGAHASRRAATFRRAKEFQAVSPAANTILCLHSVLARAWTAGELGLLGGGNAASLEH